MSSRVASQSAARAVGLLLFAILAQAAGNVSLSFGMKSLAAVIDAHPGDWALIGLVAVKSPFLIAGVALLTVFFVLFAYLLSHLDLTIAMPIVSFEVVLNVACAHWILGETVSPLRWLGSALVAMGVALVGISAGAARRGGDGSGPAA